MGGGYIEALKTLTNSIRITLLGVKAFCEDLILRMVSFLLVAY